MASIFSAKNETVLALANANLDFSLVKVEVKKEYEGLGRALSISRRESAENGQQHRTARRLGALFEEIVPDIDLLARAYGQRASEIAMMHERDANASTKLNSTGFAHGPSLSFQFGPFASHAGIDGTSIYAAASSGSEVIALHLLACMFAKVMSSVEATAIWVQLVEGRLEELKAKASNFQISGISARIATTMGSDIRREDLAAWDASARAWLEVANTVKRREHTQVKLIFQNMPNIQAKNYSDIIENWKLAMATLQKAIQGVPQDISNGAALLGITAWHIYPDIIVFDPIKHIQFNDTLVNTGGTISLGLARDRTHDDGDVNWSVSLSHLRYYGEPVAIERSLTMDTDRITIQDLQYIALGCVFSKWTNTFSLDVVEASECFVALGDCIGIPCDEGVSQESDLDWLALLIAAARDLLNSQGEGRENALYFIEFGRRRGRSFLDDSSEELIPMFGLLNPYQLFLVSRNLENSDQEVEQQIGIYRDLALDCGFGNDECIVVSLPKVISRGAQQDEDVALGGRWEIASARPIERPTSKRFQDGTLRSIERHTRWVHLDRTHDPALQYLVEQGDTESDFQSSYPWGKNVQEWDDIMESDALACSCLRSNRNCDKDCSCRRQNRRCNSLCQCLHGFTGIQESLSCTNVRACRMEYDAPEEDCFWLSFKGTMDIDHCTSLENPSFASKDPPLAFHSAYQRREKGPEVEGSLTSPSKAQPESILTCDARGSADDFRLNAMGGEVGFRQVHTRGRAGLYLTDQSDINMPQVTFPRFKNALLSGKISPELLRSHLCDVGRKGVKDFTRSLTVTDYTGLMVLRSLNAMAAIRELYQQWPDATIKISITKSPIGAARWCDWSSSPAGYEFHQMETSDSRLYRARKFACIIMMESGGIDLHPDQLGLVMGIATGNSIYAAEYLLQDPSAEDHSGKISFSGIKRIIGSLGEPGIVCLVPPRSTKRVLLDNTQHRTVRHDLFDGSMVDHFEQSSLHLTLTAWKLNLAVGQGSIDADVLIREALISVFDGSRWIADLDILKALEDPATLGFLPCFCPGVEILYSPDELGKQLKTAFGNRLKSISNWNELLLCQDNLLPEEIGTVRSSGNWYARLAAMALASSIGCPLTVLPPGKMCLQCGQRVRSWQPSTPKFGQSPNLLIM